MKEVTYLIPCVICGSPIITTNPGGREYCDGSTGLDCMRLKRNYQKSKTYRFLKETEKYNTVVGL